MSLCISYHSHSLQGIAVNPELAYTFVEREDDEEGPLFLIATGRLGDTPTEPIFSALGNIRYVDSIQGQSRAFRVLPLVLIRNSL